MVPELDALNRNHIWTLDYLPSSKKTIGCKWVYKIKHKANGSVVRFKACSVAKGFRQTKRINYFETFSPVVKLTTRRVILLSLLLTTSSYIN